MRRRVAMTVGISALIAGWLFWTGTGVVAAAPKVYVGLFKDNAVAVLDTGPRTRLLRTIPVPKGPHGLVITPDGREGLREQRRRVHRQRHRHRPPTAWSTPSRSGRLRTASPISGDGRQVLCSASGTNQRVVIDTATDRVIAACRSRSRTTAP